MPSSTSEEQKLKQHTFAFDHVGRLLGGKVLAFQTVPSCSELVKELLTSEHVLEYGQSTCALAVKAVMMYGPSSQPGS